MDNKKPSNTPERDSLKQIEKLCMQVSANCKPDPFCHLVISTVWQETQRGLGKEFPKIHPIWRDMKRDSFNEEEFIKQSAETLEKMERENEKKIH